MKNHFIVEKQQRKNPFDDDEEEERRRLEGVLKAAGKKPKVIRGRCREMLKPEWVSLSELWYRQTSPQSQAAFRKVFREIHEVSDAEVASLRSVADLSFAQARSFRLAKVMLKLYFSVVLRPEYYKRALYWGYTHGPKGEHQVRTIFGGIESLVSLKFSHYKQAFGKEVSEGAMLGELAGGSPPRYAGGASTYAPTQVSSTGAPSTRGARGGGDNASRADDTMSTGQAVTVQMLDGWQGAAAADTAAESQRRLSNAWDPQSLIDGAGNAGKRTIEPLRTSPSPGPGRGVTFKSTVKSSVIGSAASSAAGRHKQQQQQRSLILAGDLSHWKPADAEAQRQGFASPSWVVENMQKNWSTTNRDHYSPKRLPQFLRPPSRAEDGSFGGGGAGAAAAMNNTNNQPTGIFGGSIEMMPAHPPKDYVAPNQTASSGSCLPRSLQQPPPRSASATPGQTPTPARGKR